MISLSTITSYTGANGVLLDAQQTGLKTVGFVHRLKSFFNIGDAREKNRATLNALKDAILTDPRFNTPDLQAEVERLFKNEHTFLAVDMSRIRGIMDKMARLADGSGAMLDRRVDLHLAAVLSPSGVNIPLERAMLMAHADLDDIALIAKRHVRNAAVGGSGVVDVATLVGEALDRCAMAIMNTAPLAQQPSPDDMKYVGRHLQHILMRPLDRTLRTKEEVAVYVSSAFDFARWAHDMAQRNIGCPLDASRAEREAAEHRIEQHKMAALEFACTVGERVGVRMFEVISDYVARLPLDAFGSLKRNSSAADIRTAIQSLAGHMAMHPLRGPNGTCPFDNLKATKALARYLATLVALRRLPDSMCDTICGKLHCSTVAEAMEDAIHDSILHGVYYRLDEND